MITCGIRTIDRPPFVGKTSLGEEGLMHAPENTVVVKIIWNYIQNSLHDRTKPTHESVIGKDNKR